jgi:hypothetical protein
VTVRGALELNIESPGFMALLVPDNDVMHHVIKITRYSQEKFNDEGPNNDNDV